MRNAGVLLFVVLSACAGSASPNVSTNESLRLAGHTATFPKCGVTVALSGPPTLSNPTLEDTDDVESVDAAVYEPRKTYGEGAICKCFKRAVMSNTTRFQAVTQFEMMTKATNFTPRSSSWDEKGKLGKTLKFEATSPHPLGTATMIGATTYLPKCAFTVFGITGDQVEVAKLRSFLDTPTQIGAAAKPETPNPRVSASPASERLRELQRLRDEKLITEQEFEQKRKAILEAL